MNKNKIIIAALIGNAIEYFDFTLYGFFTPLFATLFFPTSNPSLALLSTLGIFAASFIVRPVGGVIFGHLGDKYGRKTSLSLSIFFMAVATLGIALIPTYEQIGVTATISLCLFRLLQGLSTGGEFNGAFIFLIEHAREEKAGFLGSLVLASSAVGGCLALLSGAIALSANMQPWAWRIPFFLGSIIGFIGMYIRLRVDESPEFLQCHSGKTTYIPFVKVIKEHRVTLLRTTGAVGFGVALTNILIVYLNLHLNKHLGIPLNKVFWLNNMAVAVLVLVTPLAGALSDKIGQIVIMRVAALASFVLALPIFLLLNTKNIAYIIFAEILLSILTASYGGVCIAYMFKMFPIHVRYSGTALSYCLGSAIFGGTAPILSIYLIQITGNLMMPAYFMGACSIVALFSLLDKKSYNFRRMKLREFKTTR